MSVALSHREDLNRFVVDAPATQQWKLVYQGDSTHARWHIPVTDDYGVTLMLFLPRSDGQWMAYCACVEEQRRTGTLAECREWLQQRATETRRLADNAHKIGDFAARRPAWTVVTRARRDRPYARRTFHFPEVPAEEKVCLFLTVNPGSRRAPFAGEVSFAFSGGPEECIGDEFDAVTEWLSGWEKALSLPARLRECADLDEASEVVRRAPAGHVVRLGWLFGFGNALIGGTDRPRRKLIDTFCEGASRVTR